MKRLSIIAVAALFLTACDNQEKFTIEGNIEGASGTTLYLDHIGLKSSTTLDSIKLDDDGAFCFRADRVQGPEFYLLRIQDQIINISIDSTETVTVKGHYPNMAARYEVEGSENCSKIRELALLQQELHRQVQALDNNGQISPSMKQDSLSKIINAYKLKVRDEYIFKGPNMTYAYFALFQTLGPWLIFDPEGNTDDIRVFAAVATSWDTFHPNTDRTKNLHDIVIKGMSDQRIIKAQNELSQSETGVNIVESGVIDLNLTDNKSTVRTLTELKGKVVLLDFHSFQLESSPQRILWLRDLYNKYHDQGFEIYQVSLDKDEHFWLQKTLQLPWVSVRDVQGQSAISYQVAEIPEYFLIDRNNQLQKRSSQITDLEGEIKKLLSFRP